MFPGSAFLCGFGRFTSRRFERHINLPCAVECSSDDPFDPFLAVADIPGTHIGTAFELELIQSHMAQKLVLRSEVGCACVAREVSVERGGMGERGCARRLGGWVWV